MAIRFDENDVRPMSRTATGVKAIRLKDGDEVVGMARIREGATVMTVTDKGQGRRTPCLLYTSSDRERIQHISYTAGERRKISVNGVPCKTLSELAGEFYCVVFNPDDLDIVKDGPSCRRQFLDTAISQIKPIYGRYLIQYENVLEQRNVLLKEIRKQSYSEDMLDICCLLYTSFITRSTIELTSAI